MINDISEDDIAKLNDTELRELIGKLCESTLEKHNIDSIGVTYGGKQDEPDGGVDVRVKSSAMFDETWAIPRNNTIIQVKKPKMTPNEIEKEMKKNGIILESIKELVELQGAYIIVSSGASLTDKTLKNRIDKMKSIMADIDKNEKVKLDFYDSKRIATWVKQFPSIVIWVNEKTNKKTIGWNAYGNWSNPNEEEKEFIVDEKIFIHKEHFDNKMTIIQGINEIRNNLATERKVVRLTGLSGVGKTRFAQALFDKKIGTNYLNKNEVIYCDIGNEPNPTPISFVQELLTLEKRVILIVDNCDDELHNKLGEFVSSLESKISLMTIEYDVKDDINIESDNYYLDISSDQTIREFLKRDFNYIKLENIETIVKCSNGNFRIARYLAKTIDKNANIGILSEKQFFERLFYQKKEKDEELLDVARVASIFISVNTKNDEKDSNNELNILSKIVKKDPIIVSNKINELTKRQIIQKRGNMRAVLPHAIANRLADEFLGYFPIEVIIDELKKSYRMEVSLFRRLSYLYNKDYSKKIVEIYLDKYNIERDFETEELQYMELIHPEKLLSKIEQIEDEEFFKYENVKYEEWIDILESLACEGDYYKRALNLLIKFAKYEEMMGFSNIYESVLSRIVKILVINKNITTDEQMNYIITLMYSHYSEENHLALKIIQELLKIADCMNRLPILDKMKETEDENILRTKEEYDLLFIKILRFCEELILNNRYKNEIKEIISSCFPSLTLGELYNELENIISRVLENETWPQIWTAIEVAKKFLKEGISNERLKELNQLQKKCIPQKNEDKIIAYLNDGESIYKIDKNKTSKIIEKIGQEIALDRKNLKNNLYMIKNLTNNDMITDLAKGLYKSIGDNEEFIYFMLEDINKNNEKLYISLISKYISIMDNENNVATIFDNILANEKYNKYYTKLQLSYKIKEKDIDRIKKSIEMKVADICDYYKLADILSDIDISKIIELIKIFPKSDKSDELIINILHELYKKGKCKQLDEFSREFIVNLKIEKRNKWIERIDEKLCEIMEKSFSIQKGKEEAIKILLDIAKAIEEGTIDLNYYYNLTKVLIKLYPLEFLDCIFIIKDENIIKEFRESYAYRKLTDLMDLIDDNILIKWMEENNKVKEVSFVINPTKDENKIYKWREVSKYIFENYIENVEIIENLLNGICYNSWKSRYSSYFEKRVSLAIELEKNQNEKIRIIGRKLEEDLKKKIIEKKQEEKENQEQYETFE